MTTLLILLFGIREASTGRSSAGWLAAAFRASMLTLATLWWLNLDSEVARGLINLVLCFALFLTAATLIFRSAIMTRYRDRFDQLDSGNTSLVTVVVGPFLAHATMESARALGSLSLSSSARRNPRWRARSRACPGKRGRDY